MAIRPVSTSIQHRRMRLLPRRVRHRHKHQRSKVQLRNLHRLVILQSLPPGQARCHLTSVIRSELRLNQKKRSRSLHNDYLFITRPVRTPSALDLLRVSTGTRYSFRYSGSSALRGPLAKLLKELEARAGIEPAHKGFADLSLTTWVPRLGRAVFCVIAPDRRSQPGGRRRAIWSGRRDLNSRPSPWQGDALPLSYSRLLQN